MLGSYSLSGGGTQDEFVCMCLSGFGHLTELLFGLLIRLNRKVCKYKAGAKTS